MTTAATHLRSIALHWTDLTNALGQPAIHHGFGIGLRGHLATLEDPDTTTLAQARIDERADTAPDAPGERPVPVRLTILDTMRQAEAVLLDCADQIASSVQRPVMNPLPDSYPPADRRRRGLLVLQDRNDPRRWSWTGGRPAAPYAALWLLARVQGLPGPFRALTVLQIDHVTTVARDTAGRIERALDIAAQRKTLEQRHECGGAIDIHGGEGRPPVAHCTGCGRIWTEQGVAA
ncbi:hypothetical protein [Streptomyces sp. NPDC057257]|uniref:hypothetical protein n=1 Tax=Streptomyces sp. NPDC057257 TaxID=3346071 RepID=UPI0036443FA7